MNADAREALARYLLSVADDELVTGYRSTDWTGVAPTLEEDLAFSSMGNDEVGHARRYYALLHELTGENVDYRARPPWAYLHARLLEIPTAPAYDPGGAHRGGSDWAFTVVRQFLYDVYDDLRLDAQEGSMWTPLALAVDKIRREEKYHLQHGHTWMDRLATGQVEARARLEDALGRAWPDALGLFEPVDGEDLLVDQGLLEGSSEDLRERWLERLAATFAPFGMVLPEGVEAVEGGRRGEHTDAWREMWDQMTSVYRLDPAATW